MTFDLSFPTEAGEVHALRLDAGETLFVLGANEARRLFGVELLGAVGLQPPSVVIKADLSIAGHILEESVEDGGESGLELLRRRVRVGRAPIDWQDFHMEMLMPSFRDACAAIKRALDPNGVIAPGRYGIY